MSEKSLIVLAYDHLAKCSNPVPFRELFDLVLKEAGIELTEAQYKKALSSFYTQISLDGRFVCFSDNTWDLRSHHKFNDYHIVEEEKDRIEDAEERKMDKAELGKDSDLVEPADEEGEEDEEESEENAEEGEEQPKEESDED